MRKQFFVVGFGLAAFLAAALLLAQTPTATETPQPTPMLVSTSTPTPMPSVTATITPNDAGTVSVPSTLEATPAAPLVPSPSPTPIPVQAAALGASDLGWSEKGSPVFRLDQAVITALAQNPTVLQALEEIRRTKGVIISIRAEALPQIGPGSNWNWTDPNLRQTTGVTKPIRNLRSDI